MTLPKVVEDVLRVAAPTLLAGLLGPLGGVAAAVATAALNAWLGPPAAAPGQPAPPVAGPATTQAVVQAVQANADNPQFLLDLKKAELDLQKYQADLGFRFEELAVKDRESIRGFARDTGLARPQFFAGMGLVCLSLVMLLAVIVGCVMAVTGNLQIDPAAAQLAIASFGLIGTVVGFVNGYASTVISFYFGASKADQDKSQDLSSGMADMAQAIAERPVPAPHPAPPPVVVMPPAPVAASPPEAPALDWKQGPYGGARWALTPDGVLLEGQAEVMRTVGEPATIRRIWRDYGPLIVASCSRNGVPLELAAACIATETRGIVNAQRVEPDGRASLGLMQTLVGTASEVMGRTIQPQELLDPAISIEAGVRYLSKLRSVTGHDPVLAAAAYNAGGLYPPREDDSNRWRLRSTGDHIDRFAQFYGDSRFVAQQDGWSH